MIDIFHILYALVLASVFISAIINLVKKKETSYFSSQSEIDKKKLKNNVPVTPVLPVQTPPEQPSDSSDDEDIKLVNNNSTKNAENNRINKKDIKNDKTVKNDKEVKSDKTIKEVKSDKTVKNDKNVKEVKNDKVIKNDKPSKIVIPSKNDRNMTNAREIKNAKMQKPAVLRVEPISRQNKVNKSDTETESDSSDDEITIIKSRDKMIIDDINNNKHEPRLSDTERDEFSESYFTSSVPKVVLPAPITSKPRKMTAVVPALRQPDVMSWPQILTERMTSEVNRINKIKTKMNELRNSGVKPRDPDNITVSQNDPEVTEIDQNQLNQIHRRDPDVNDGKKLEKQISIVIEKCLLKINEYGGLDNSYADQKEQLMERATKLSQEYEKIVTKLKEIQSVKKRDQYEQLCNKYAIGIHQLYEQSMQLDETLNNDSANKDLEKLRIIHSQLTDLQSRVSYEKVSLAIRQLRKLDEAIDQF